MRKFLLFPVFAFLLAIPAEAQDIDGAVKKAVDALAAPLNIPIDVSVGLVTIDGSGVPSALSRYLAGKVSHHAINNTLYKVVPLTRGPPSVRPAAGQKGLITGSFTLIGNAVEVTLELRSETTGRAIGSQSFTVPVSLLEEMGINILPENLASPEAVKEREEILAPPAPESSPPAAPVIPEAAPVLPPAAPVAPAAPAAPGTQTPAFTLEVWPNSDTAAYFDGDEMKINLLAGQDCYFKVYHIDVNGQMQLIYPNQYNRDNRLRANTPRTIPESPVYYPLSAPYGVETILAVASAEPFQNLEQEMVPVQFSRSAVNTARGLGVGVRPGSGGNQSPTVSASFTYSILSPAYADEVLLYPEPADMGEALQILGDEIRRQGGGFSGDNRAGSFTLDTLQGGYTVSGDTLTLRIRYTGTSLPASRTRSGGFNFSFERPRNLNRAIQAVRSGIERKGGSFSGDEQQGSFRASGIAGQYRVAGQVSVIILEKPLIIPNRVIEREIKNYFAGH
jgi:hypothetical protein